MKKLNFFLPVYFVILAVMLGLSSCNDDPENPAAEPEEPAVVPEAGVNPSALEFDADATEAQTITINANTTVSVVSDATWCMVEMLGGEQSNQSYSVKCLANNDTIARTTTIRVMADDVELATVAVSQSPIVITPLTVDMVYNALGLGWNLGNQLDAHIDGNANETSWGNPAVTQSLFDAVKRAGFTSVRIPVTWMGHIGEAPDYTIDEAWLNRVAEVVGYAEKAGLTAIINIHHDGADSNYWLDIKHAATDEALNAAIEAKLAAIWTQIARKFADKGEFLIFESMNEIHDGGWGWGDNRKDGGKQYRTFNHWQQVFVDAVRATGGRNLLRWLGVPAYNTNIDLGANLVIPTDPSQRVIVAVHCYEPYDYTLAANYPEWGHTGTSGKKPSSNEKTLIAEFDKVVNRWISKGIPVYIGEMGCVHRADARAESFRKYYLEYFAKGASDRRIPMLYWDNGYGGDGAEQSGLFDRTSGTFHNNAADIVKAMNRGFFDTSVTLDDIYNSAPK